MEQSMSYVSVCGMLGYGYPAESLRAAMDALPRFVGADNGSTDPGPFYLGSGKSFLKRSQLERDLRPALKAARIADIPLIIGSAGGSGARPHLELFLDVLRQVAAQEDLHFRLAYIPADIDKETVHDAIRARRITPCGNSGPLTEAALASAERVVGQMGTAPIATALAGGANVVVAGRCCDTAIFAALPIAEGYDAGLALHAAKIAECGALCARPAGANDGLICTLHDDHFVVRPANPTKQCSPESVAAHSLYEQPDPHCFFEPEGKIDMSDSRFEQFDDNAVKVEGTKLLPAKKNTIKLEGASLRGWRSFTIAGIHDPVAISQLAEIESGVREAVAVNLAGTLDPGDYRLRFLRYGMDAVLGELEDVGNTPHEVGLLIEAIAPSQELADTVLSLARSTALHQHYPGRKTTAGNLAFPFSPSDFQAGPVYEFSVYHLMETDDADSLFPVVFEDC